MRICIDSNQFIFGLSGADPASEALLELLPELEVVIPRLVIKEVTHNLNSMQTSALYMLLHSAPQFTIVDETPPTVLVSKYVAMGLRLKGDAIIAAFAEWQAVDYVVSDNRHFLRELKPTAYDVLDPHEFLARYARTTRP